MLASTKVLQQIEAEPTLSNTDDIEDDCGSCCSTETIPLANGRRESISPRKMNLEIQRVETQFEKLMDEFCSSVLEKGVFVDVLMTILLKPHEHPCGELSLLCALTMARSDVVGSPCLVDHQDLIDGIDSRRYIALRALRSLQNSYPAGVSTLRVDESHPLSFFSSLASLPPSTSPSSSATLAFIQDYEDFDAEHLTGGRSASRNLAALVEDRADGRPFWALGGSDVRDGAEMDAGHQRAQDPPAPHIRELSNCVASIEVTKYDDDVVDEIDAGADRDECEVCTIM